VAPYTTVTGLLRQVGDQINSAKGFLGSYSWRAGGSNLESKSLISFKLWLLCILTKDKVSLCSPVLSNPCLTLQTCLLIIKYRIPRLGSVH